MLKIVLYLGFIASVYLVIACCDSMKNNVSVGGLAITIATSFASIIVVLLLGADAILTKKEVIQEEKDRYISELEIENIRLERELVDLTMQPPKNMLN